mmetsp:Transcript_52065/g.123962  ORF Transcript_52065/g.123962 Transcript_52065/m.123962 type:complete len:291 (+) Transcript_52065:108-980(+)
MALAEAAWWENRLASLECQAAAATAQAEAQQRELASMHFRLERDREACKQYEVTRDAALEDAALAKERLQVQAQRLEQAHASKAAQESRRRGLLGALEAASIELGGRVIEARTSLARQQESELSSQEAEAKVQSLRSALRRLGDEQATLDAAKATERRRRRELREEVREGMRSERDAQIALEQSIMGHSEEVASWRAELQALHGTTRQAEEEAQQMRQQVQHAQQAVLPRLARDHEEIRSHLSQLAQGDEQLREELGEAQGRLSREQERSRAAQRPWARQSASCAQRGGG